MGRKEKKIVFLTGIVLLLIFTFSDLQISMAVASRPAIAKIPEILGEIPFTLLAAAGCAMLVRFRNRKAPLKNIAALVGGSVLLLLFSFMGGFMTWNYLRRNFGDVPAAAAGVIGLSIAAAAIFITLQIPAQNREKATSGFYSGFAGKRKNNADFCIYLVCNGRFQPCSDGRALCKRCNNRCNAFPIYIRNIIHITVPEGHD